MNEDYLWDKSGEPDPEIEQLEQTLGRLRYKRPPQPLPLPIPSRSLPRPSFSPMFAIAAALVILLLAGGLWLGLRRSNSSARDNVATPGALPKATPSPQITSGPPPHVGPIEASAGGVEKDADRHLSNPSGVSSPRNRIIARAPVERRQEVAVSPNANSLARNRHEQTIREGEMAKEQLIKALHITSDKLNVVQKKIQGNQERGPIS